MTPSEGGAEGVSEPLVLVVVVDYDGGGLTLDCLRSVLGSDWPADRRRVMLVDNASRAPVIETVVREFPAVEIVRNDRNRGFAGGVNVGLRRRRDADFVALVNNDATVDPGWLAPLVQTLESDVRIGAACPKMLLATDSIAVELTATTHRPGRGDARDLGVRCSGARVDGADVWDRVQLVSGFWGAEPMPADQAGGQWTSGTAQLRAPVSGVAPHLELRLAADAPITVDATSGTRHTAHEVGTEPAWYTVETDATPVPVINNVGTELAPDGYGRDRGWLELDRGQFDTPVDVDAWCGGAVLLRREYLDDVGDFDESLFLYYEDVELSRRGSARGWRYRTAPDSVVRHVHSATASDRSAFAAHYNERNRLLVTTRHAAPTQTARAVGRYLAITASYAQRDVVAPLLRGEPARPEIAARRLRAFGAYVRGAPGALRARRRDGSAGARPG
jgi:GT2 family glycosyltransferase